MALLAALAALALAGALVAALLVAAGREERAARLALAGRRADALAAYALARAVAGWHPAAVDATTGAPIPLGDDSLQTIPSAAPLAPPDTARALATRLVGPLAWIVGEGVASDPRGGPTRRRQGLLVRLVAPRPRALGALTVRGGLRLGPGARVDGGDAADSASACSGGEPAPGIAAADLARLLLAGGAGAVRGSPAVALREEAALDATYERFESADWDALAARAAVSLPPGTSLAAVAPALAGTGCDAWRADNWGEPERDQGIAACASYLPLVHAAGDLTVGGGRGQGILLVDGDLTVSGALAYSGLVIVRGRLVTRTPGVSVLGALLVANGAGERESVVDSALVRRSGCAVTRALDAVAVPVPVRRRAWVDLFGSPE